MSRYCDGKSGELVIPQLPDTDPTLTILGLAVDRLSKGKNASDVTATPDVFVANTFSNAALSVPSPTSSFRTVPALF